MTAGIGELYLVALGSTHAACRRWRPRGAAVAGQPGPDAAAGDQHCGGRSGKLQPPGAPAAPVLAQGGDSGRGLAGLAAGSGWRPSPAAAVTEAPVGRRRGEDAVAEVLVGL